MDLRGPAAAVIAEAPPAPEPHLAFVVRMTIIPAVMAMLGQRAWWLPAWLDRIIPNVDLEGTGLERRAAPAPPPDVGACPGRRGRLIEPRSTGFPIVDS